MAITEEEFARAARVIAAAPFEPALWADALALYARAGGGWGTQLLGIDPAEGLRFHWSSGLSTDALADFDREGGSLPNVNPRIIPGISQQPLTIIADDDFIDAEARRRSPFYQGLCRRHDGDFISMARLPNLGVVRAAACILRSRRQGHAQTADHERMVPFLSHLASALRFQMTLEGQADRVRLAAMDALSIPAFLCDALGHLVAASAAGELLLREGHLLQTRLRTLCAVVPESDHALQHALRAVSKPRNNLDRRIRSITLLSSDPLRPPTVADIAPLPHDSYALRLGAVTVMALQRNNERSEAKELLYAAYRLSPAEAEVAMALAAGQSVEEIAHARNGSPQTVRTQLKALRLKLGVDTQAKIVQAVSRLIGGQGGRDS